MSNGAVLTDYSISGLLFNQKQHSCREPEYGISVRDCTLSRLPFPG